MSYNYIITQHEGKVELYIDRGKESEDENKKIFDELYYHKDEIEETFGDKLNWQRLDNKKACRISKSITLGGYRDPEKWDDTIDAMIDSMIRLEKALSPTISKMKI